MPVSLRPLLGLAAALALAWMPPAQAGRPLQTEDAAVLERGDCEIELVAAQERAATLPPVRGGSAQFGCGVGLQTQAAVFGGRSRVEGQRSDTLALVGKTALRKLTEDSLGVTVAWGLGATRETGSSFEHEDTQLKLVLTQPLADWLLHANLGWARSQAARSDSTLWSLAAERSGLGPLDAMAEVFGDDRSAPWINAGLRWNAIPGKLFVDGSYGVQLKRERGRLLTLGLKIAF